MSSRLLIILFSAGLLLLHCKDVTKIIPCVANKKCTTRQINQCYPGEDIAVPCPGQPRYSTNSCTEYRAPYCELQTHAFCEDDESSSGCRTGPGAELGAQRDNTTPSIIGGVNGFSCVNCRP